MSNPQRKELGWPAAATLIAAMIGAVVTSIALAIAPTVPVENGPSNRYATAREIGEVKARLAALEESSRQLRVELRGDIKEVRDLMQQLLKQQ
ncbi:MAG: hypothetical protein MI725_17580 [Pirellulales bacterium]|nr:hypothetical protein [Pirellulales bacterium]